jgi:presenilin-like A22 family membrane protease
MTMVYLFIPLTIEAMSPEGGDGWNENEIGFGAEVINVGDVDDDGILEVVVGCSDNRVRIYEGENHTLEWESPQFTMNISNILIEDIDDDSSTEFAVLTDRIRLFEGNDKTEIWNISFSNFTAITLGNSNLNASAGLVAGTNDSRVILFVSDAIYYEFDLSDHLDNISFLDATENGLLVAADGKKIITFTSISQDVETELEITELETITALTVYDDPQGEDLIIAADDERPYIYNLTGGHYIRKGPKISEISDFHLEIFDIPKERDSVPDIVVISDEFTYILPDLMEYESFYWLRTRDMRSFHTTDFDGDGTKEMILGYEDGYIYDEIIFVESQLPIIPLTISIVAALLLTIIVHKYPEWYVVDTVGLVMAIGAVVILGVTFAILPAVVLLIILAIYDAISVYKTKHMITLADSVIDLNLPVLLVIPKKLSYSYRKEKPRLKEQLEEGKEREAMFMGLGDIVIPSLLIVSAISFLPANSGAFGLTTNVLVAIGTMIGILIGFSVLMRFVLKGNPQAGLPLLNSGALLGYAITYILVYGELTLGFNLNFM